MAVSTTSKKRFSLLLLLPMLIGTERGGSKLWLSLGPFSFQPGEIAKILIVLFLAAYLAENRELLSASTRHVGPFSIPRPRMLAPLLVMWGISLLVVIFEKDLGNAVEGEEVPGVPQGQQHLAHRVTDGPVSDHEVAAAHHWGK